MSLFTFEGMTDVAPPNVLAERYTGLSIRETFSDDVKIRLERDFWVAMMEEQARLGVPIPQEAIDDYRAVAHIIDKDSIRERELVTRHDVNARLEEFNARAGHQHAQKGMTSRDLTENVEQLQIRRGMEIIDGRSIALLGRFASRAAEYSTLPMAGRSHNVAAQAITLGKRFAYYGEELLYGQARFGDLIEKYPLRGVKGPVGTQQDMLELFDGDEDKVNELETRMMERLGFGRVLDNVGQIYPRSLDFDVVSGLKLLTAAPSNMALTLRLMAGHELATEGFKPGQVGSNAMPHKMNSRTAERIAALGVILNGHVAMAAQQCGNQWNEGDVSDSASRRVFLPDSFFATDGIFQSALHITDNYGAYPEVMKAEFERYMPFLMTTKLLIAAEAAGTPRQDAHHAIRDHAVAVALEMREQGTRENDLFERLVADPTLKLTRDHIDHAIGTPLDLTGMAQKQVVTFIKKAEPILAANPEAAAYQPEPML